MEKRNEQKELRCSLVVTLKINFCSRAGKCTMFADCAATWRIGITQTARDHIFYPRDALLARVTASATCLSDCLSVTRRYCVKTKKASVMISSPSGSPMIVFWRQSSSQNSKGFPPNGSLKEGWGKNIQPLRHIRHWISQKPLEIEALFKRTTNEMVYGESKSVMWLCNDVSWPERSNSWPQYDQSPIYSKTAGDAIQQQSRIIRLSAVRQCGRLS